MLEAADEVEVEEGSARVYRHSRAGGGGNVWILWAANESDGARVRLPAAAGAASVHRLDGAAEELPGADGWLALDLPGGARLSPPLLVVDDD
jgi:hypothetical protein